MQLSVQRGHNFTEMRVCMIVWYVNTTTFNQYIRKQLCVINYLCGHVRRVFTISGTTMHGFRLKLLRKRLYQYVAFLRSLSVLSVVNLWFRYAAYLVE